MDTGDGGSGVEFVDDEPPGREDLDLGTRREPRRLPRRVLALALAAAGALAVLVALRASGSDAPVASGTPAPTRQQPRPPTGQHASPPAVPTQQAGPPDAAGLPTVTDAGHPLLGGGRWELFGLGAGVVVRIQPAIGRVWTTPLPALQSGGPVSFVVTSAGALVRPIDFVPGYRVGDGQLATPLTGPLSSGPIFPGPTPSQVWRVGDGVDSTTLLLTPPSGGARIALPPDASPLSAFPDGGGAVIVRGVGGLYDASPGGLHRITTGSVVAVGPSGWLVAECDASYRCGLQRVERAGFAHLPLPPGTAEVGELETDLPGVLSPDGSTAAVLEKGVRLGLLRLRTGSLEDVSLPEPLSAGPQQLVWSPDGRWLLALTQGGALYAVDPGSGQATDLGVALPALDQLAVRAGE